jgi:hypothetical protein
MDWLQSIIAWVSNSFSLHRPWTKTETVKLFSDLQNPKVNRPYEDCARHWVDVIRMIFKERDRSLKASIMTIIADFHRDLNAEQATQIPLQQTEAEHGIIQFLVDKKAMHIGLNRPRKECEAYFQQLIVWIAKKRNQSTDRLVEFAIAAYYESQESILTNQDGTKDHKRVIKIE